MSLPLDAPDVLPDPVMSPDDPLIVLPLPLPLLLPLALPLCAASSPSPGDDELPSEQAASAESSAQQETLRMREDMRALRSRTPRFVSIRNRKLKRDARQGNAPIESLFLEVRVGEFVARVPREFALSNARGVVTCICPLRTQKHSGLYVFTPSAEST
jgi:hypothetical protein